MTIGETNGKRFEDYLGGESEVSRAYRQAAREEPSPAVDEAVLAAARDAVARPRAAPRLRPIPRRWLVPLALAATVLLSVSLVTLMPQESWRSPPPKQPDPVHALEDIPGAPTTDDGKGAVAEEAGGESREIAGPGVASGVGAADRADRGEDVARKQGPDLDSAARQRVAEAKRRAAAPRPETGALAQNRAPAQTPESLEKRRDEALDELERLLDAVQSGTRAGDTADARARVSALRARLVTIASQWTPSRGEALGAKLEARDTPAPAQRWLREIERLLELGRHREAEWQMALFRSRHPEEALPPALRPRFGR